MGICGLAYLLLGSCMLISVSQYKRHMNRFLLDVAGLYPSLFKVFDLVPPRPPPANAVPSVDDGERYYEDEEIGNSEGLFTVAEEEHGYGARLSPIEERLLTTAKRASDDPLLLSKEVAFRFLAYLLALFGLCRLVSACYSACGYVYLGMASCMLEIGIVASELLLHKSVRLHGAMGVLLELGILSEIYLGTAIPYCRV
jgi:hypothetical protein